MENNQAASALANDIVADEPVDRLAQFVAEHRQGTIHAPSAPLLFESGRFSPESEAAMEAREKQAKERAERRRQSELMERSVELLRSAGERYRGCGLDNFKCSLPQQRKVVAALREYIDSESHEGIVLYGPVGTGKDHLAFAVCRWAVKSGRTVKWINGQTWFGLVRDAMDTNRSEASLVSDLAHPSLLCVSDPLPPVGVLSQHQSTMLYRIIDARYAKGLPTICTINVASDQEADDRMGAATWDRLCHDAWKLNCNWPTYRQPAREV